MADWIINNLRLRWAGVHLGVSLLVSCLIALIVFLIWYPAPLWNTSGGLTLFIMVVVCDLVLGPLVTLLIANPAKPKRELRWDVSIIVCVQLLAMVYGVSVVFQARPIHIVFERDQYRVVRDGDVPESMLKDIPAAYTSFPKWGPTLISLRAVNGLSEQMAASTAEMEGIPLSAQPKFWQPYALTPAEVSKNGKPLSQFVEKFPSQAEALEKLLARRDLEMEDASFFPFVDKTTYWTVVIKKSDGFPAGYLPVDPYEPEN